MGILLGSFQVDTWSAYQCCRGKASVEELCGEEEWVLAKSYDEELV